MKKMLTIFYAVSIISCSWLVAMDRKEQEHTSFRDLLAAMRSNVEMILHALEHAHQTAPAEPIALPEPTTAQEQNFEASMVAQGKADDRELAREAMQCLY